MEAELRKTFGLLAGAVNDIILLVDPAGCIAEANDRVETLLGITPAALQGQPLRALSLPAEQEPLEAALARLAEAGSAIFETIYRCADGDGLPVEVSARVIKLDDGDFLLLVARDLTDRLRAEEERRNAEAWTRLFFDLPFVGMAVSLPHNRQWYRFNDRLCEILGYTREEMARIPWDAMTHPEDLDKDLGEFERTLRGESDGYEIEKRFVRRDGEIVETAINVKPVRGKDGKVRYFFAIVEDVTLRRAAERDLMHEKELLQATLDNIPVMISVFDDQGRTQMVNRAFETTLGWKLHELQDFSPFERLYPDPEQRREVMEWIKRADGFWGDFRTTTRDGRVIDTSWADVTLRDGTKIGIGLDISERKETEARMERSLSLYSALSEINHCIVRATSVEELLQAGCRVLGEQPMFHIAWVGLIDPGTGRVRPTARYPTDFDVVDQVHVSIYPGGVEGRGLAGMAAKRGGPAVSNDFLGDPITQPWREVAARFQVHSGGAFPIRQEGRITAMLFVYSDQKYLFDAHVTALLDEFARDLSFGLERLALKK